MIRLSAAVKYVLFRGPGGVRVRMERSQLPRGRGKEIVVRDHHGAEIGKVVATGGKALGVHLPPEWECYRSDHPAIEGWERTERRIAREKAKAAREGGGACSSSR